MKWLLVVSIILFIYFISITYYVEGFHNFYEIWLTRKYPDYYQLDSSHIYYPTKYRWNYGPCNYIDSNLGKISKNYEPNLLRACN